MAYPMAWIQSLIITLSKTGNLQLCQNYRTISLISHSSKVMLKVILNRLNRLKPQAEEIIAEEQAGFRAGRSTTEQIFNLSKRKRGRQKKRWEDNITEWTRIDFASSTRAAENRSRWKGIVANSSVVPRRPSKVMG